MARELRRSWKISGKINVPGDKSIAHRAALFSILAKDKIVVRNFPDGADCQRSLSAAQQLGVTVQNEGDELVLTPPDNLSAPESGVIDCGNSGTTARLLAGIAAGSDIELTLGGDESLSGRPMKRIIDPLTAMGAELFSENGALPLRIRGSKLAPFDYRLPVASAQVKTALLLAALASNCSINLKEDSITRDHTELMLQELGDGITVRRIHPVPTPDSRDPRKKKMIMPEDYLYGVSLNSRAAISGGHIDIPGDMSTAAFFFAAAAISKGTVTVDNLGLNPTRIAFLEYLKTIGCRVEVHDKTTVSGEVRGNVTVVGSDLKARKITGNSTVGLIDEIPIVAVIAAFAEGTTIIRDAAELRVKESDRLSAVSDNLGRAGIKCALLEDGLAIEGASSASGADFASYCDHRIAMAFSIAGLFLEGPSTLDDDSVVGVSCPEFYSLLDGICA